MRATVTVKIVAIYVASRVITTGLLLLAGTFSPSGSRFGPGASLSTYVLAWDAQWYQRIASNGYPTVLPLTDAGDVAHNAWAFMPVFPWVAGVIGAPFGSWGAGAVLIALVAGLLCCVVLHRILVDRVGQIAALWAVAFFASAPLAAMFQVAYPETAFLLLILLSIDCLQRRRYGWMYPIIVGMAFLRPGVLALALTLGCFGVWRWATRDREALRTLELANIATLTAFAGALGLSWPIIAASVTGRWDAYLQTELSWRRLWMADEGGFVPFEGWFQAGGYWFDIWGLDAGWVPIVLLAGVVAVGACLLVEPHVKRLGVEVRLWAAGYLLYLLAVFLPQSSIFRLLFPLSPLWGAVAQPRSTVWRVGVLTACVAGQAIWIWNVYGTGTEFWDIP